MEGVQGARDVVMLCLMLLWLGKRKRARDQAQEPGPALLLMQDLAEKVNNLRAGERTTAMFTVLKLCPEISLQRFKKLRAWLDPNTSLYAEKSPNSLCSHVLIITKFF